MELLVLGLLIFFGIHLVPAATGLHTQLIQSLGPYGWKGVMSLVAIAGFVLIVIGWQHAPYVHMYSPPAFGYRAPHVLMLPALILLAAAYIPSNIKRFTRHPMLWGTVLWAIAHLFANGDLRSLLLFGSFLLWALFDMWSATRRGAQLRKHPVKWPWELLVVAVGLVAWLMLARFHGALFGVAVARLA